MTTTLLDEDGNPPTIRRGTSPTFVFAVEDLSVSPTGPKNLTGATEVTFAIARHRGAPARDLMLTLGQGTSHDDAGGNVTVVLSVVQTEGLPYGDRWCELWITDAQGRRDLVGEGLCRVLETLVTVAADAP